MFDFLGKKRRAVSFQIRSAHEHSEYGDMPLEKFEQEIHKLAAGLDSEIDFDEGFYLAANADVERAVAAGDYLCGYIHYCLAGRSEPRLWSNRRVTEQFGLKPQAGQDLFAPTHARPYPTYAPDLSALPDAQRSTLLVLVPALQEDLFFAGYSGFFADLKTIFPLFERIIVMVMNADFSPELVERVDPRIEVLHLSQAGAFTEKPHLIFVFDAETFHVAKDIFADLDRTVYYCQDFEAGFVAFGTRFVRAERAVAHSRNIVLSTGLLRDFLARRHLLTQANVHVTAPQIKAIAVDPAKKRKLFFYFRPERFNTRNMPELVMETVDAFCRKHTGYEIYLCGAVKTCYSVTMHGTEVYVLSKLPKAQYEELLGSCDVVVAMIYSAHPGVIAFQAAASGIPTVTNTFEGRDAHVLKTISDNIVPFDPIRDDLLEKLEEALLLDKGQASFNAEHYEGRSPETFLQYVESIMQAAHHFNKQNH